MIWCEPRVIITINKVVTGRFAPGKTDNITNGYAKIQKIIQKDCRNAENPHCIFRIFAVTARAPAGDSNGCVLCRCPPQIGTPWQLCIISPSIFRQPDKKKGTVSKSQCLRLSPKQHFDSYASCGSTHKFREHGPGHPLLPLCSNSPCVSRNLYKGRNNVPARRDFSPKLNRKRGFDREAARKTLVFPTASRFHKVVSSN